MNMSDVIPRPKLEEKEWRRAQPGHRPISLNHRESEEVLRTGYQDSLEAYMPSLRRGCGTTV